MMWQLGSWLHKTSDTFKENYHLVWIEVGAGRK